MSVCQRKNTELLIQIDARKASWSGTKVCEITALEIVFTAHCYLSHLLEPRSSKWGNGLRSGGGRNNKQTTWQRRPSTVADASRNALRFRPWCLQGRNIFNILRMRWAFFFQPMSNTSIDFANERLLVFACTSVQPDSLFWCLNSACFSSQTRQIQQLGQWAK